MKPKFPGGCKNEDEFAEYIEEKIIECLANKKSKEETVTHLLCAFHIRPEYTIYFWDKLEEKDPDYFIEYEIELEKHRKNLATAKQEKKNEKTKEYIIDVSRKIDMCIRAYRSKDETEEHLLAQFRISPEITSTIWDHLVKKDPGFFSKYNAERETNRRIYDTKYRIEECLKLYKNKEETVGYLWDKFKIRPEFTTAIWNQLGKDSPVVFSDYNAARENNRKIRERNAPSKRPSPMANEQDQQQQQATESNATDSSEEVQPRKKQRTQQLQDSQQAVSPMECVDLWKQILSTLTRIADNSDLMLKLMTGSKSREKQQVEQEHVIGDNEQPENLQDQDQNPQRMDTEKGNEASEDSSAK